MSKAQMDAARRGGVSWGMADDAALEEDLDNVTEGAHFPKPLCCSFLLTSHPFVVAVAVLGSEATFCSTPFLTVFTFNFLIHAYFCTHVQQAHQRYGLYTYEYEVSESSEKNTWA